MTRAVRQVGTHVLSRKALLRSTDSVCAPYIDRPLSRMESHVTPPASLTLSAEKAARTTRHTGLLRHATTGLGSVPLHTALIASVCSAHSLVTAHHLWPVKSSMLQPTDVDSRCHTRTLTERIDALRR